MPCGRLIWLPAIERLHVTHVMYVMYIIVAELWWFEDWKCGVRLTS